MWTRNVFDEWWVFNGFNIKKLIVDLFQDEDFVMNLVEMILFFFTSCKKGWYHMSIDNINLFLLC
jgi:hypothetical protein